MFRNEKMQKVNELLQKSQYLWDKKQFKESYNVLCEVKKLADKITIGDILEEEE